MSDLEKEVQRDIDKIMSELKRCTSANIYYDLVAKLYYLNELIVLKKLNINYPKEYWFEYFKKDSEPKKTDFERFVYHNAQKYYDYNLKMAKMSEKLKNRYVMERNHIALRYVPFVQSLEMAKEFFKSFDEEIYDFFINMINSPRFVLLDPVDDYEGWALRNNYLIDTYTIIIPNYFISDYLSIVHETIHSFNFKQIKNSSIKEHDRLTTNALYEAPSFFTERVALNYLEKRGFNKDETQKIKSILDRELIYLLDEYKEILLGDLFEYEDYLFKETYAYGRLLSYHFYDNYVNDSNKTIKDIKRFMYDYKIYDRDYMLNNYGLNSKDIIKVQKLTKYMDKNLMRL